MWGHYWFRLILLLCARIISVWDCTNHCLPPTTGCIGKPSWIRSDQQRTLICANPANDRVCQSGLSWWHLMSRDEKDRSCWMTGCARKNVHFIQSSKELRAKIGNINWGMNWTYTNTISLGCDDLWWRPKRDKMTIRIHLEFPHGRRNMMTSPQCALSVEKTWGCTSSWKKMDKMPCKAPFQWRNRGNVPSEVAFHFTINVSRLSTLRRSTT